MIDDEALKGLLLEREALEELHRRQKAELDRKIFAVLGTNHPAAASNVFTSQSVVSSPVTNVPSPALPVSNPPLVVPTPVAMTPVLPTLVPVPAPEVPEGPPEYANKCELLMWYLRTHDGVIEFYETARLMYGTDSDRNRMRVTRLLHYLQKCVRLKRIGTNTFKIID